MSNEMICPKCQARYESTKRYCALCGTALISQSSLQPERTAPQSSFSNSFLTRSDNTIAALGTRLDGWADVIIGSGHLAARITEVCAQQLESSQMPGVQLVSQSMKAKGIMGETRPFNLAYGKAGATVAIQIHSFGSNLFMAWSLYIRPIINWWTIGTILVVAAITTFILNPNSLERLGSGGLIDVLPICLVFGFALTGLSLIVAMIGRVMRSNAWAFFFEEVDSFVADDITAMTLSVHKAILEAVDEVGLDANSLRAKREFQAGQRGRLI
jgi:hypothetical protein